VWAVVSAGVGLVRTDFPRGNGGLRVYVGITGLLVLGTLTAAIATSGVLPSPPWSLANGDLGNARVVSVFVGPHASRGSTGSLHVRDRRATRASAPDAS